MAIGVIFALFCLCFVAIIMEELFFGGRKLRRAKKLAREKADAANTCG